MLRKAGGAHDLHRRVTLEGTALPTLRHVESVSIGFREQALAARVAEVFGHLISVCRGIPAEVRRAADQGYTPAQFVLARLYERGQGVGQSYAEALRWYHTAAIGGNTSAMTAVGYFHFSGLSVAVDHGEALQWYRKAGQAGHPTAQHNLGHMHEHGIGVERNLEEALRWYRLAAAQGYEDAIAGVERLRRE